jgi:hypothetical protein
MKRRQFLRSLGGAVAAAMLPFAAPMRLSAPKKANSYDYAFDMVVDRYTRDEIFKWMQTYYAVSSKQ